MLICITVSIMSSFRSSNTIHSSTVFQNHISMYHFLVSVLAPLSKIYGRKPVYHACNIPFLIFTVGCAVSQNMGTLIAFRFLAGVAGVATVTCGSGTIADLMPMEKRGVAMSFWSLGLCWGRSLGRLLEGF